MPKSGPTTRKSVIMQPKPSAHVTVPPELASLLDGRSDPDEIWLRAVETGTRLEGAAGKPWAWFCLSDQRAVLACAAPDTETQPLWRPLGDLHCKRSRVGRDEFREGDELSFLGPLRGADALRAAVALASAPRAQRLRATALEQRDAGQARSATALWNAIRDPSLEEEVALHLAVQRGASLREHRYAASPGPYTAAWVATNLPQGVEILAALETSTDCPDCAAPWWYVLTETGQFLAAADATGARAFLPLNEPIAVTAEVGRDPVTSGSQAFRTTLANEKSYHDIAPASAMERAERVVELARLHHLGGDGSRAVDLLSRAIEMAPSAELEALRVLARGARLLGQNARDLLAQSPSEAFAGQLDRWQIPELRLEELIASCLNTDAEAAASWTLPFQRRVFALRIATLKEPTERAAARLSHGRALNLGGDHLAAQSHLDTVLDELPGARLEDLAPEGDELDTDTRLRVEAWTELGRAGRQGRALAELAMLTPLERERVEALAVSNEAGATRAAQWLEVLDRGALRVDRVEQAPRPIDPGTLEHPLVARSAAWEKVQGFIATQDLPDTTALRAYCEPLGRSNSPDAVAALADATIFLGLPVLHAFVSRGDRRRGVRAFDADPPFLLIGADHLEEGGDVSLSPTELRFAIGAEAAHVRLGHVRITSGELWTGVWDKSWSVADFALALTPAKLLEKPLGAIGKGLPYLQRMGLGSVQDAVDYAGQVAGRLKPGGGTPVTASSVGPEQRELLGMARALQLSADRAGLLLCGNIHAAVRAIFVTSPAQLPLLTIAERQGLGPTLDRRDEAGRRLHPELAIRIGALARFWLSPNYDALRGTRSG